MSLTLSLRKSHKYTDSYASLDDWDDIGTVDLVSTQSTVDDSDICEPTTHIHIINVTSDSDKKDIEKALSNSFSHSGCSHEYDCCGCTSTYTDTIKHIHDDIWEITLKSCETSPH
jgi:hypothetical protein